jgi:hypothetical protein
VCNYTEEELDDDGEHDFDGGDVEGVDANEATEADETSAG